jgi:hypothetical protein
MRRTGAARACGSDGFAQALIDRRRRADSLCDPHRWPRLCSVSVRRRDRPYLDFWGHEDPQRRARLLLCIRRLRVRDGGRPLFRQGLAGGRRIPSDGAGRHADRPRHRNRARTRHSTVRLRQGRGGDRSRHVCGISDPGGRPHSGLGNGLLFGLPAARSRGQFRGRRTRALGLRHGLDRTCGRARGGGALGA